MSTPPARSALTNRQLAQARVMCDLLEAEDGERQSRIQRSACEDAALFNLRVAYQRLLAEAVEVAGLELLALPADAASLDAQLEQAGTPSAAVKECVELERSGWLQKMLWAAQSVDAMLPRNTQARPRDPDIISLGAADEDLPLLDWYRDLKALIARIRQSNAEW